MLSHAPATDQLLEKLSCCQLICVSAKGSTARFTCFDKICPGLWRFNESLGVMGGYIGRNGVTTEKHEGDGCTPAGLFRLGFAFGNREKPKTAIEYRHITANSVWVDDPVSPLYNSWLETSSSVDWHSAEKLSDFKEEYAYAVVIEYNTADRVPGKGSAIFLHCGNQPTAGCSALPEQSLLRLLAWLDPVACPCILIQTLD